MISADPNFLIPSTYTGAIRWREVLLISYRWDLETGGGGLCSVVRYLSAHFSYNCKNSYYTRFLNTYSKCLPRMVG